MPIKHCDDYINDPSAPKCLRLFLLVHRLPATEGQLLMEHGMNPRLFATYKGRRVRVVMASRFGDVGISSDFKRDHGYDAGRVPVDQLTDFRAEP